MSETNDIWTRSGKEIIYPGLIQTDYTCVFVSIAGAINYIAGTSISEKEILGKWQAEGSPSPSITLARKYLSSEISENSIKITEYHDTDNRLQSVDRILDQLRNGAVLIPSLEYVVDPGQEPRQGLGWHMLSVFNLQNNIAQVWDTNGQIGFVEESDITNFLTGECIPIPYYSEESPRGCLVSHDKHEAFVVSCPNCE